MSDDSPAILDKGQLWRVLTGDARTVLPSLPAESVNVCVTSPPYFNLRDYGVNGQIGLEQTPEAYVAELVAVFREVRRVLTNDGTLWLNIGDSFCSTDKWGGGKNGNTGKHTVADGGKVPSWAVRTKKPPMEGIKPKDLIGIPWMLAFALRADGWYLRCDIVWAKTQPMPESVKDRPTRAHEFLFLLAKSERYFYDADAIKEPIQHPNDKGAKFGGANKHEGYGNRNYSGNVYDASTLTGRNKRSVWTLPTAQCPDAHFAVFPPDLVRPCIRAGCPVGGIVLDPFAGSGTSGLVALEEGRRFVGVELNPTYAKMATRRIGGAKLPLDFTESEAASDA